MLQKLGFLSDITYATKQEQQKELWDVEGILKQVVLKAKQIKWSLI